MNNFALHCNGLSADHHINNELCPHFGWRLHGDKQAIVTGIDDSAGATLLAFLVEVVDPGRGVAD